MGTFGIVSTMQALAASGIGAGLTMAWRRFHAARRRLQRVSQSIALLDIASDGILIHHNGIVLAANEAFCRLVRRRRTEVLGCSPMQFVDPATGASVLRYVTGIESRSDVVQVGLVASDGQRLSATCATRQVTYESQAISIISFRDTTDLKLVEARALHLSSHDPLTDLVGPALFETIVSKALIMAAHHSRPLAVIRLDIDRSRKIREEWGDGINDRLMQIIARRLREVSEADCTAARLGGDDFAVLLPRLDQMDGAVTAARRLLAAIHRPYQIDGRTIRLTASIGVATYPSNGNLAAGLLSNAWTALQRAKKENPGSLCFFEPAMDREMQRRTQLISDLRVAIARHRLEVHYQPLLECSGLFIAGYEALLRWQHPTLGAISPAEFIPIAEDAGLIAELGAWVAQTACTEAAGWNSQAYIAVNLSPAQFQEADLKGDVARILAETGLAPHRLELEVTEGMLIADPQRALQTLLALKELGIGISLDDFGTGYSSLRYLQQFPFDRVKIDKSFVQKLGTSEKADAIVDSIMGLARGLKMLVTAEGVETQEQYDALHNRDCDIVQGFMFSKAMPAASIRGLQRFDLNTGKMLCAAGAMPQPYVAAAA